MAESVLGVIPARGGSKGIQRKNLRALGGKPLLVHTIECALRAGLFSTVVVTTDDEEIRAVALAAGAQAPFLRPAELATDGALAVPTIQHAVREMEHLRGAAYDVVMMLQPTAPLRAPEDIRAAITELAANAGDGIISVVHVGNNHPMKMKRLTDGVLTDYDPPAVENPPRQSLPPVYIVNGAIYATRREVLMSRNSFRGTRCLGYVMPRERSVNIDTEEDFILAEYYLAGRAG